uniref:Uncharacterized protein n=1 Tax=Saccharum officinarum TaxID=4547 RepID=A0A678TQG9_SACOF|nr:hypothetical protein SO155N20_000009 [Saccharum officinarum]
MTAAADDLARGFAAFLPVPLLPPPQKQQLSGVAAAVLNVGGRAVGDVFGRLRIDDTFYSGGGMPKQRRRNGGEKNGRSGRSVAGASAAASKDGATGGGDDSLGSSRRFAQAQGSKNRSATYDSRTNDVESSAVARGDLWRAEASRTTATATPLVPLLRQAASPAMVPTCSSCSSARSSSSATRRGRSSAGAAIRARRAASLPGSPVHEGRAEPTPDRIRARQGRTGEQQPRPPVTPPWGRSNHGRLRGRRRPIL